MPVDLSPLIDVSTEEQIVPYEDLDDGKNHMTHIVRPYDNQQVSGWATMTAQDIVDMARMLGLEIVALCGYRFIPVRNPENYDACQQCVIIAGTIMSNEGE